MQIHLKLLRARLGQFGLNPMDWCVEVHSKCGNLLRLDVSSSREPDLCFEGWAENGNWISLAMAAA
jgi:hypothetical protein